MELAGGDAAFGDLQRLFANLGFRSVATIKKSRTTFHITQNGVALEVALDRADDLGDFAEIEAVAATEADLPAAQSAVLALARRLGLSDVEPRSYLRIFLEEHS